MTAIWDELISVLRQMQSKERISFLVEKNHRASFRSAFFHFFSITVVSKSSLGARGYVSLCLLNSRCQIRCVCLIFPPSSGRSPRRRKSVNNSTTFYCLIDPGYCALSVSATVFILQAQTDRIRHSAHVRYLSCVLIQLGDRSFNGHKNARLRTFSPGIDGLFQLIPLNAVVRADDTLVRHRQSFGPLVKSPFCQSAFY
jgi:hypothetical protein